MNNQTQNIKSRVGEYHFRLGHGQKVMTRLVTDAIEIKTLNNKRIFTDKLTLTFKRQGFRC